VRLCGSVRTAAQTPWRTAANYSDLSARRHITGSPVDKVSNGLQLHLRLGYCHNEEYLTTDFI